MKYLAFYILFTLYLIHNIHIYQLNYYKPHVQMKWLKNNIIMIIINTILSILFMINNIYLLIISCILLFIYNFPKKAKKKLVYTPRIIRMLSSIYLFITIIIVINYYFIEINSNIILGILMILTPLILLLIDFMQRPLNKHINNTFINDAKRILNDNPNLIVIGITGSYGKTSMKYYVTNFLETKYNVLMTPGNLNTTLGVVRTIRENLKSNHEIFVCEMGATKLNDIKEICDIVKPKYGIITSIGPQHLESFKSIDNVIKTKFELADAIDKNNYLFLNYDNEYIKKKKDNHQIISYGTIKNIDYQATDIKGSKDGLSFKVNGILFTTKLIGIHNIQNITGALSVANKMGIPLESLVEKVRRLKPVEHRLELKTIGNRLIIDDAYNSNPIGSKYALDSLKYFDEVKVLMTPGMVELGEKENEYNYEFGKYASNICDYVILVNENQTKAIYQGLIENKYDKNKIFVVKTINDGFNKLNDLEKESKLVVLIENDLPDQY